MDSNIWNTTKQEQEVPTKVKLTRNILAVLFAFLGFILLFSQVVPLTSSYVTGKMDEWKASRLVRPIPDAHKELLFGAFAYYNPGKSYFANLSKKATELTLDEQYSYDPVTKKSKQIVVDKTYIPSE